MGNHWENDDSLVPPINDTNEKYIHRIEYSFQIRFNHDNLIAHFTGQDIKFTNIQGNEAGVIRPRHLKIVSYIQQIMVDYVRNNR